MDELLERTYLNNPLKDYLIAAGIVVGAMLLIRIFRNLILRRLKKWAEKSETKIDDILVDGVEKFGLPLLNLVALYGGLTFLELTDKTRVFILGGLKVAFTFYLLRIISFSINHLLTGFLRKQEGGEEKIKQLKGVMILINVLIWLAGLVFLIDNLGYNVTTIVTTLGVGGIAVALAAQTILGDLFNYFVIFFDRPFEIGDFIIVDDKMGTIERIGIKTTRIKSLSGEQIVFSNSDLTGSRIHNYKRMLRRRVLFKLGVIYQTSLEKLKMIPGMMREIIERQENIEFDRAHLSSYGDFSINFEVVYYVIGSDYNQYMDIQQSINLLIFEHFKKNGIEFAYPTQSIFVEK